MKGVGERLPEFSVVGVKPGFNAHEEKGESAFETITQDSFPGKWKVIYFYPKDFTFVCPTEIAEFAKLNQEFVDRDAVVLGGSTDNEFCKLAWRRAHADLHGLNHHSFADTNGSLVDGLGVRDAEAGVALRATFIVDPNNVIQHVSVNNLHVGRSPQEILRLLDALQSDELCPCNRAVGGPTLERRRCGMDITTLRERLPEYAKDLKLNLGTVLTTSSLSDAEAWGSGLAAALVSKHPLVIRALKRECGGRLSPQQLQGVAAAAAIMSMTNVWYKLIHIHDDAEVKQVPARLRMQVIGSHGGVDKRLFEAWSLAASAVNGCAACVTSHTQVLRKEGMTAQNIADIGRIAAVVKAVSEVLSFDEAWQAEEA